MTSSSRTQLFYGTLALLIFATVATQVGLTIDRGNSLQNMFSFFTVEANLTVMALAIMIARNPQRSGHGVRVLELAALAGITVTGIVYAALIGPNTNPQGIDRVITIIFHYVVPVLAVGGFFVWRPRSRFDRAQLVFIAWPILWLVYTMLRAELFTPNFTKESGIGLTQYPYGFLDVDVHGWSSVIPTVIGVTIFFLLVASFYIAASRRLSPTVAE